MKEGKRVIFLGLCSQLLPFRESARNIYIYFYIYIYIERERDRQTDRQTERQRDRETWDPSSEGAKVF